MKKKEFINGFWQLFRGYWTSEQRWRALGLFAIVVGLNFAMVYLLVQINTWYNEFYNALQGYKAELFWPLIGKFAFLAFLHIAIAVYAIYLRQLLQLRWRTWMTEQYLAAWLKDQSYYRLQLGDNEMDNPEQRIQQDISEFVTLTLQFILGFLKQLTTLAAFAVVLWNLSGSFEFSLGGTNFVIPGYMLWFSLVYSVFGTGLAHIVGRKLIGLNFEQQKYEADFRFAMTRVRENSESIAFYGGELPESLTFKERFMAVVKNYRHLMHQTKLLNFYSNSYAQFAIIVPLIMAAPRYFSGAMTLGGLMQTNSAFGRVQDALSYFVEAYDGIAQLTAVIYRLTGFTEHLSEVQSIESGVAEQDGGTGRLVMEELTVNLPDGRPLMAGCQAEIAAADRVLITGESGCGKSTLLRTLAGLWPFAAGKIMWPNDEKKLFLPQRPYLPLGSLRKAIYYPLPVREGEEAFLAEVLAKVDMAEFADKLDTVDDWSRILSLGEQQRIAFARVLIVRPQWLFLDEATSALDEAHENEMYSLLQRELPEMSIVSVGHRSTLFAQHKKELHITEEKTWQLRDIATAVE